MSRRVFYIVHLDKGRIAGLSLFAAGLLLTAFATGYRLAGPSQSIAESHQESPQINLMTANSEEESEDQIPSIALNESDRSESERSETEQSRPERREKVNLLESALDDKTEQSVDDKPARKVSVKEKNEKRREEKKKKTVKKEKQKKEPAATKTAEKTEKKPADDKNKTTTVEADTKKAEPASEKQNVYVLQMGAYQSRDAALRLSQQIRKHGINTYVRKTGNIHTVRTDGTSNREELFRVEKKLKSLNFSPVTVLIRNR